LSIDVLLLLEDVGRWAGALSARAYVALLEWSYESFDGVAVRAA
jgi:hypothetical protein